VHSSCCSSAASLRRVKRAAAVLFALVAIPSAAASGAGHTFVGPMRLVSPSFGYVVEGGGGPETLRIYAEGRWRDATPPLGQRFIEDVSFADELHGWVAEYDCGRVAVYLFRTANGGRSWTALGRKGYHSCGGGPMSLSFVDATHGWMLLASRNAPSGAVFRTEDAGRTWRRTAALGGALPCLGTIAFESRTDGWLSRCDAGVFRTRNGGRTWTRALRGLHDVPRAGVAAAVAGGTVSFDAVTGSRLGTRRVSPCTGAYWPESVAAARAWWVVDSGKASVTENAGTRWRTVAARGLPSVPCAVTAVSAPNPRSAWAVARVGSGASKLFATRDGGRTWRRA
jgi:photosystem II stability/assembly factor-like uncharacterized protein